MKKIFYLILTLTFYSCTDDDNNSSSENLPEEIDFNIESYYYHYAYYSKLVYPNGNSDNLIKFQYNSEGKIIKRIGDLLYISPNAGTSPIISDSLFTDLIYYDNKIKLTKGTSYLGSTTLENESIITLDSQHKILEKANRYQINSGQIILDTIRFNYDSNNKLISYIKTSTQYYSNHNVRNFEESTLYYNTNANVDSIVSISYIKLSDVSYTELISKKTRIFENYDTSSNPFKKTRIFEETFYRSLSNNNYRKFTEKTRNYSYPNHDYYADPVMGPTTINNWWNWDFSYDSNGNWLYN